MLRSELMTVRRTLVKISWPAAFFKSKAGQKRKVDSLNTAENYVGQTQDFFDCFGYTFCSFIFHNLFPSTRSFRSHFNFGKIYSANRARKKGHQIVDFGLSKNGKFFCRRYFIGSSKFKLPF